MDQGIRQGEDTSPYSRVSSRPMSHDVVVHVKLNLLNFAKDARTHKTASYWVFKLMNQEYPSNQIYEQAIKK